MKLLLDFFVRHLSNILGVLSIIITLYLGLYYVPSWFDDAAEQKLARSKNEIEQSIKELVYSDSTCSISEIEPLIRSAEGETGKPYPIATDQILSEVASSFMNDKYLPLITRRNMLAEIRQLRLALPKIQLKQQKADIDKYWIVFPFSAAFAVAFVFLIIRSLNIKTRREKAIQEEINNQLVEPNDDFKKHFDGRDYEIQLTNILKEYPDVDIVESDRAADFGYDIHFTRKNKHYYVEIKYLTNSKVALKSIYRFISFVGGLNGEFWFIHNQPLTPMSQQKLEEVNFTNPYRHVKSIFVESPMTFKAILPDLFN